MNQPRKQNPPLTPLRFGSRYCELCKVVIDAGQLVGWWQVRMPNGRIRKTIYCQTCHHANTRAGRPLR